MIERKQYRGCLKKNTSPQVLNDACKSAKLCAEKLIEEKRLLTASLYEYNGMCFLYYEALEKGVIPEDFLSALDEVLETWPEEQGLTSWVPMYPIYWHQIPDSVENWQKARNLLDEDGKKTEKDRIGRIAFVYPEKPFSYTYWHQAIVGEGLLKGDQYQFISLHENILFSYFETPKHMVNIKNTEEESKVIREWMEADPESHFDRVKAGGENFRIIPALFSVG